MVGSEGGTRITLDGREILGASGESGEPAPVQGDAS